MSKPNKRKIEEIENEYQTCEYCQKLNKNCECNKENEVPNTNTSSEDPEELEPLSNRKRRLSLEAESREKFDSEKGRLLNYISIQINASQELLNQYETKINKLLVENSRLNQEYNLSFKDYWYRNNNCKELIDYRECIIYKICENNNEIENLKISLKKQQNIYEFLYSCNYYIDKSMYE